MVQTAADLRLCCSSLLNGTGPVAIDAERAGGFRYSQRAYLVQLRRQGSGTLLIDPVELPDLSGVNAALGGTEWIIHAANQDLPCLAEVGMAPDRLFDTELAGRLLNDERVGLSAMTEKYLGVALAKDHSAADWSRRPLPDEWLAYAALDVELLVELREEVGRALAERDRTQWAVEEFEAVRVAPPPAPRVEPWRRIKGLSTRSARVLAISRELWLARDEVARAKDRAPGRVLPDSVITRLSTEPPTTAGELEALPALRNHAYAQRRLWWAAVQRGQALPAADLPGVRAPQEDVPNVRSWERINPVAAARLDRIRKALGDRADSLAVPRENLLGPRILRSTVWEVSGASEPALAWEPDATMMAEILRRHGARPWQVAHTCDLVVGELVAPAVLEPGPDTDA